MTLKSRQLNAIRDELRARLSLAYVSTADELDIVIALIQGASAMYMTARDEYRKAMDSERAAVYAAEMDYQRARGAALKERRDELLMAMDEEARALRFGAQRAA